LCAHSYALCIPSPVVACTHLPDDMLDNPPSLPLNKINFTDLTIDVLQRE